MDNFAYLYAMGYIGENLCIISMHVIYTSFRRRLRIKTQGVSNYFPTKSPRSRLVYLKNESFLANEDSRLPSMRLDHPHGWSTTTLYSSEYKIYTESELISSNMPYLFSPLCWSKSINQTKT